MKTSIIAIDGQKKEAIELPRIFESEVRFDLIRKAYEAEQSKLKPKYGAFLLAGKLTSAPKQMRHKRDGYRAHYGQGISRIPRKIMSRRGSRFFRVGAFSPGTRGGRAAHPPKAYKNIEKNLNEKERKKALYSAISAVAKNSIIVEKRFEELNKTKEAINAVKKIIPKDKIKNMLIVTKEKMKTENLNIKIAKDISVSDLIPDGQHPRKIVLWTENAIGELK